MYEGERPRALSLKKKEGLFFTFVQAPDELTRGGERKRTVVLPVVRRRRTGGWKRERRREGKRLLFSFEKKRYKRSALPHHTSMEMEKGRSPIFHYYVRERL